jgi:hypothetical protein
MLKKGLCGGGGNCCGLPPVHGVSPCTDGRINSANVCPKCSGDCAYWDQPTYQQAMDSKPDVVTIMLGTNDAKGCNWDRTPDGVQGQGDHFENDFADMIAKFRALIPKPKIYVVLPPPLFPPWPYLLRLPHPSPTHKTGKLVRPSLTIIIIRACIQFNHHRRAGTTCQHTRSTSNFLNFSGRLPLTTKSMVSSIYGHPF